MMTGVWGERETERKSKGGVSTVSMGPSQGGLGNSWVRSR